jgi:hypothetical protein
MVAGGWFVVREKYCWLVADKPSEQGDQVFIFFKEKKGYTLEWMLQEFKRKAHFLKQKKTERETTSQHGGPWRPSCGPR